MYSDAALFLSACNNLEYAEYIYQRQTDTLPPGVIQTRTPTSTDKKEYELGRLPTPRFSIGVELRSPHPGEDKGCMGFSMSL